MGSISEDLIAVKERLLGVAQRFEEIKIPIDSLIAASEKIARCFSGSWLGYHAYVYYENLEAPPPRAHFSAEWGLELDPVSMGTRGNWREYSPEKITEYIIGDAGNPDVDHLHRVEESVHEDFKECKDEIISLLHSSIERKADTFLDDLLEETKKIGLVYGGDIIDHMRPKSQQVTRDSLAVSQGFKTPPHVAIHAKALAVKSAFKACKELANIAGKAAVYIERRTSQQDSSNNIVGTHIFIGHGRSPIWKDLKDFIQDRLGLPWDEFNRVPIAGITNISRLSQMLDSACFAFLVMTAEDETAEGELQARMNVIHEVGLFQGRLGFEKAIVLLEDGCQEFSNIHGLGEIRFPAGNISAKFEDIRRVLERERLLEDD